MANQDHLDILRSGVERWNKWREANDEVVPDLYNANLRGANLGGAKLGDAALTRASLRDADVRSVTTTGRVETCVEERPRGPNYRGEGGTADNELVGDSRIRPAQSLHQAVNLGNERVGTSELGHSTTPISRE